MTADTRLTPVLNATLSYNLKIVCFAVVALMFYDISLNLHREITYIWSRRPTLLGILYTIVRYGWLLVSMVDAAINYQTKDDVRPLSLLTAGPDLTKSAQRSCNVILHADFILRIVAYTGGAVFVALRAYALSGGKYAVAITIFLLNETFVIPNFYELSKLHGRVLPMFVGCQAVLSRDTDLSALLIRVDTVGYFAVIRVSRTAMILSEVAVVILTWTKTRAQTSDFTSTSPTAIARVLFKNGILCFIVPIVLTSVVWALNEHNYERITAELVEFIGQARDALVSIVTSHFLLDLGELAAKANIGPMSSIGEQTLTRDLTPGSESDVLSVLFEEDLRNNESDPAYMNTSNSLFTEGCSRVPG
ncbi:hypothetical protein L226DRAFT_524512 [Lentinus tigrinus ALCF2SS1-7]|uniref:uncharacterized protein n=1 Tax=Lentinus tigrinus ALCF2SS1-7 TaxID=1328758 RepID=UPI0011661ACC|nr:hypothetical protein L226DRAFT_524512 [Lentinus tigrinus ALCF2SS1-7]